MRSPEPAFDLRTTLTDEVRAAQAALELGGEHAAHRCRVRLKRARALARIGRVGAPGLAAVFNTAARGTMRTLADARGLEALAAIARRVARKAGKRDGAALLHAAGRLEAARRGLHVDMDQVSAGLRDLAALAQVWPDASARQVDKGVQRIARKARRARRRGRRAELLTERHEWRKREKDRLYALLILGQAWPDDCTRRRKIAQKLADALGHERDVVLLCHRIVADPSLAGGDNAAARVLKVLNRQRARLAARADRLGAMLKDAGA